MRKFTMIGAGLLAILALSGAAKPQSDDGKALQEIATAARAYTTAQANPPGEPEAAKIQREREDLVAQRQMARAADRMLDLTLLQIWIGILGTIGLAATVGFSWRANHHARRAADAAEKQADDARQQLRAHVADSNTAIFDLRPDHAPGISITLKNYGLTSAYDFKAWGTIDLFPSSDSLPQESEFQHPGPGSILGAGADIKMDARFNRYIDAEEYGAILKGLLLIVYVGSATYRDVFGKEHQHSIRICTEVLTLGSVRTIYY